MLVTPTCRKDFIDNFQRRFDKHLVPRRLCSLSPFRLISLDLNYHYAFVNVPWFEEQCKSSSFLLCECSISYSTLKRSFVSQILTTPSGRSLSLVIGVCLLGYEAVALAIVFGPLI